MHSCGTKNGNHVFKAHPQSNKTFKKPFHAPLMINIVPHDGTKSFKLYRRRLQVLYHWQYLRQLQQQQLLLLLHKQKNTITPNSISLQLQHKQLLLPMLQNQALQATNTTTTLPLSTTITTQAMITTTTWAENTTTADK